MTRRNFWRDPHVASKEFVESRDAAAEQTPFPPIYLCEQDFPEHVTVKQKVRIESVLNTYLLKP